MNAFDRSLLPVIFPAAWARAWGQDQFGLFMILELQGIRQCFRWMRPATFMMGSPEDEPERYEREKQHLVTLTQGFWLADSACTQALWQAVMSDNPSRFQNHFNNPVENVSWDDVQRFIEQLNQSHPGLWARLPTEAEWEYACRAGTSTAFSFGGNITTEQVNYDGNYPYAGTAKGVFREKTVPVKCLPANRWGLYGMHGNVWEWCADWYGDYESESIVDPTGPGNGSLRVLRGGSWNGHARYTRSAIRDWDNPAVRFDGYGFRLALGQTGVSPAG